MTTFVILAHRDPSQVARLIDRLAPHNVVVHYDAQADQTPLMQAIDGASDRIKFVPDQARQSVRWAGFSIIRATIAAYQVALEATIPGDHIVLLSGQCYPIKPVEDFVNYLSQAPFRQHARMFEIRPGMGKYYRHLAGYYNEDLSLPGPLNHPIARRQILRLSRRTLGRIRRKRSSELTFGFGSQWIALTTDCVQHIVSEFSASPVIRFTAHSFAPDEKALHSLIANSPFVDEIPNGGIEPFPGEGTHRMVNFHTIRPGLGETYSMKDFDNIVTAQGYFVRKVSPQKSADLLDAIDLKLLNIS